MPDKEYSFFGAVEKSFDKAAKYTKWDKGVLEQIKECNAVYQSPINYTAIGLIDKNKVQLKVIDSHFVIRDVNGNDLAK